MIESVISLLETRVFESRRGLSSTLPPNLLTLSWSQTGHDVEAASRSGVLSVDVSHPVKLSVDPALLEDSVGFLSEIVEIILPLLPKKFLSTHEHLATVESVSESRDTSSIYFTPQKSDLNNSDIIRSREESISPNNVTMVTEVSLSTSQVVLEFKLETMSREQKTYANTTFQKEWFTIGSTLNSAIREGLVVSWSDLSLVVPPRNDHGQSGDLHINGLHLLSVCQGSSGFIVPPMQMECVFRQHLPLSSHDL